MKRHYSKTHLTNKSGIQFFPQPPSFWDLSPYQIARFGGELGNVILEAIQQYIFEKSFQRQKNLFEEEAFHK